MSRPKSDLHVSIDMLCTRHQDNLLCTNALASTCCFSSTTVPGYFDIPGQVTYTRVDGATTCDVALSLSHSLAILPAINI